jgi:hypothetical protein
VNLNELVHSLGEPIVLIGSHLVCSPLHTGLGLAEKEKRQGPGIYLGHLHLLASSSAAEHAFPGRSSRLLSAFSFERLMGFTLLSDTCWKCNCAHNCYMGMEAGLFSKASACLRKRSSAPKSLFLSPCRWAFALAVGQLTKRTGQEGYQPFKISRTI